MRRLGAIAIRNILRRPARSWAIFLGVFFITATLFSVSVIYISVSRSIDKSVTRLGADAMAVPQGSGEVTERILLSGEPSAFYMNADAAEMISEVEGVGAVSSQLFIVSAPLSCCTVSDTMLIGFEPASDFTVSPWLRRSLERQLKDNEAIIGSNIMAGVDGRMMFYGTEFQVAGKLEPTGMKFIDSSVYIPMSGARRMIAESSEKALRELSVGEDQVSAIFMRLDRDAAPEEVAIRVEHRLPDVKVVLSNEVLKSSKEALTSPLKSIVVVSVIQWLVSLFMIAVIYMLTVNERMTEIGMMRAIGAKKRHVVTIFISEVMIICVTAGLSGVLGGYSLIAAFRNLIMVSFGVPFLMPTPVETIVISAGALLFSMLSGLVAALLPALKLSERQPSATVRAA